MKAPTEPLYPVSLDLRGRPVLLIGGGEVAFRKARGLGRSGCRLTVVAKEFSVDFQAWLEENDLSFERRAYRDGEAAGYFLVISATDDAGVNRRVFEDARQGDRLINVADSPELCNLQLPSRIERGELQIAISTGGRCPGFARWLRRELEGVVTDRYGLLLDRMADIRGRMKRTVSSPPARARILERILLSKASRRFLAGDEQLLNRIERGWRKAKTRPA